MSVVINSNQSATLASMNLATSSAHLQRSLNRLSSGSKIVNPADDAGGLAVSMKLSATARRQGASQSNIANAVSFLQTQDGTLRVVGKALERIGELKTLYADPTKNSTDRANYDAEFSQLKTQISSLGGEKFNGRSLFGTTSMEIDVSGGESATNVTLGAIDLLGTAPTTLLTESFANLNQWAVTIGSPSVAGGVLSMPNTSEIRTNITMTSPFEVTFEARSQGAGSRLDLRTNTGSGNPNLGLFDYDTVNDTNWHSVRLVVDANGTARTYIDGSGTPNTTISNWGGGTTNFFINAFGTNGTQLRNLQITSTSSGSNDVSSVTAASSLSNVGLSSITGAIAEVASFRTTNGAAQSRLTFASELLSVNKANLEAANSRITDVDVAAESTQMARYNILVQAGTAMLSQANQSAQSALRLIG